jgi:hypothetical protein
MINGRLRDENHVDERVRLGGAALQHTFPVPPAIDAAPGILKVGIPFTDPVIVGRCVRRQGSDPSLLTNRIEPAPRINSI